MISARELTREDVQLWRDLRAEGVRLYPNAFLPTLQEVQNVTEARDAGMLAEGGRFAVFEGETPVGIAAIRPEFFARSRHRASIGPFYLCPDAQGSGAADVLMQALIDYAVARGIWQLELSVAETNPRGIAFYKRHGFVLMGTFPNAIITEAGPEHDLFLVRQMQK